MHLMTLKFTDSVSNKLSTIATHNDIYSFYNETVDTSEERRDSCALKSKYSWVPSNQCSRLQPAGSSTFT